MSDKELLELAAYAMGAKDWKWSGSKLKIYREDGTHYSFNPLKDDGDALRLAVKLNFYIQTGLAAGMVGAGGFVDMQTESAISQEPCSAVRRAIVRAAAELVKLKVKRGIE